MLWVRINSGCEFTTSILRDAIAYQIGTLYPLVNRPQGGLAVAVIRAHPEQDCSTQGL